MLIVHGTTIHVFDKRNWVIHSVEDRNFLVNEATFKLYMILLSSPNWNEAKFKFSEQFSLDASQEQFYEIVSKSLGGYNVLANDKIPQKAALKGNYLKLKVELLPASVARIISKPLQWLYDPSIFWVAFLISALIVPMVYFVSDTNQILAETEYVLYFSLLYTTMLVHELGHIGACARYGLKHGGVGFGFYFIMPVMYADITGVWLADKSRRVIANLAGIFNEILYAALLSICYLVTGNETCLSVSITVFSMVVWQFNPFVRFDGYWVISDITSTPNLLQKANEMFKISTTKDAIWLFIEKPFQVLDRLSLRDVSLFVYGLLNILLWAGIMLYTLIVYYDTVIRFPVVVWQLFEKVVSGDIAWTDFNRRYFTVLIFYALLLRLTIAKIKHARSQPQTLVEIA